MLLQSTLVSLVHVCRDVNIFYSQVIHRRLSAKNVLLTTTVNGVIAKLIGYGPSKDDGEDKPSGSAGVRPSTLYVSRARLGPSTW